MHNIICILSICLTLGLTTQSIAQNQRNDCTRGKAEPIVKKSIFPKSTFQPQADSITAIETVDFENGDRLTIRNWGCENYNLTFKFETTRFQKDTTDHQFWFKVSSKLLAEVLKGIDAPVDLKSGIMAINDYIEKDKTNGYRNLQPGIEIYFGFREPKEYVTVDRIQKLSGKKILLILTFTVRL